MLTNEQRQRLEKIVERLDAYDKDRPSDPDQCFATLSDVIEDCHFLLEIVVCEAWPGIVAEEFRATRAVRKP